MEVHVNAPASLNYAAQGHNRCCMSFSVVVYSLGK